MLFPVQIIGNGFAAVSLGLTAFVGDAFFGFGKAGDLRACVFEQAFYRHLLFGNGSRNKAFPFLAEDQTLELGKFVLDC